MRSQRYDDGDMPMFIKALLYLFLTAFMLAAVVMLLGLAVLIVYGVWTVIA